MVWCVLVGIGVFYGFVYCILCDMMLVLVFFGYVDGVFCVVLNCVEVWIGGWCCLVVGCIVMD